MLQRPTYSQLPRVSLYHFLDGTVTQSYDRLLTLAYSCI